MPSDPLTQQLYGHALCLLCWWCLFPYGWHDSLPTRIKGLSTQYAQLQGLLEPPFFKKKIARLTCRIGLLPLHKAQCLHTHRPLIWVGRLLCIGTHNWRGAMRQTKRLYKSRTLSDDSLHVNYSHETVASSMNTAGPVITDHHLKSTKLLFFPSDFLHTIYND